MHLRKLDWRNASLWGMAPHYLTLGPNPHIAVELIKRIDRGFGTSTSLEVIREDIDAFEEQVGEILRESEEARAYVRQLEDQYDTTHPALQDATPPTEDIDLPSAPELLDDLERFLRGERDDEN